MSEGIPTTFITIKQPEPFGFYVSFRIARCLYCGEEPQIFGGHLHFQHKHTVVVGYCAECYEQRKGVPPPFEKKCPGCYGKWDAKFGFEIELSYTKARDVKVSHTRML